MKQFINIFFSTFLLVSYDAYSGANFDPKLKEQANKYLQNHSLQFVENMGQITDMNHKIMPFVLFEASVQGMKVLITEKGLTYVFQRSEEKFDRNLEGVNRGREKRGMFQMESAWINLYLPGAVIKKENVIRQEESSEHFNYFLAHCPKGIYGVKGYGKLIIKEIYSGIDWVLYSSGKSGMKYDFIVHPGASADQIKLVYESEKPLEIDADGNIQVETPLGILNENAPISYLQETQEQISSKFIKKIIDQNNVEITFSVPHFFPNSTLVIDPQLVWSTFFGSDGADIPYSMIVDVNGNVFIGGLTGPLSIPLPLLNAGTYFDSIGFSMGGEAFISKFSPTGALLWSTYFGGSDAEAIKALKADNAGNVFGCGETFSTDLPTLNSGSYFDGIFNGFRDPFLVKFDNAGNLLWSTYFGGNDAFDDYVEDIDLDSSGNLFFHGWTDAADFPLLNAGTYFDGTMSGATQTVVGKFDNNGNLIWSTFYGGSSMDIGCGVTTDINGNVLITGCTYSTNFPLFNSGGYYTGILSGVNDAYIAKFTNNGNPTWSTFYGGTTPTANVLEDVGISLVTDVNANLFVFGGTYCSNIATANAGTYYDGTYNGCPAPLGAVSSGDAFLLKFNSGDTLLWGTYLGGSDAEFLSDIPHANNIDIDDCGNLYISFGTMSSNFPLFNPGNCTYFNGTYSGQGAPFWGDQVIMKFSNSGQLEWSSFLGVNDFYVRSAASLDTYNGVLYLAANDGFSGAPPVISVVNLSGAYNDSSINGGDDIIIMKFVDKLNIIDSATVSSCLCTGTATVQSITCGTPPYSYLWSNGQTTQTATGLCAGTVSVIITDSGCHPIVDTFYIVVPAAPGGITLSQSQTNPTCITSGSATVTPNGGTAPYSYLWSDGQTTQTATGLPAGTYTVTITDSTGCSATTTVTLQAPAVPSLSVSSTQTSCTTASGTATAAVTGGTSPYTYLWSDGQSTQTATGLAAGTYTVTVTDANGCTQTQTVTIASPGAITLSVSVTLAGCTVANGTATANPAGGNLPYTYLWSNGQTTQTAIGLLTGIYTVTVTDANNCSQTATALITASSGPTANAGTDVSIEIGTSVTLNATGGGTYLWSTGETTSSINVSPDVTTEYCVTVTDGNGCSDSACVKVFVEFPCPTNVDLTVPNAFSPNHDGQNDEFCLQGWSTCIKDFTVFIYGRWGEKVFESQDPGFCWDGTYKGKPLDAAVFVYYIKAELINDYSVVKKGNISLVR
jgi:gliding motility-associated-like protein